MIILQWLSLTAFIGLFGACALLWRLHLTPTLRPLLDASLRPQQFFLGALLIISAAFLALPQRNFVAGVSFGLLGWMGLAAAIWLRRYGVGTLFAGLLLLLQSTLSRSALLTDWVLPTLSDWLHLTLAATWLGSVAMFAIVITPVVVRDPSHTPALAAMLRKFSPIAMFCVLGLGLTGVIQATHFIRDFDALFNSTYGRVLLGKLALFGVLIGFGAWHQQVVMPKLRRKLLQLGDSVHHLRWSLLGECVISALLLMFVAVMKLSA